MKPYLQRSEILFGILVVRLLTIAGRRCRKYVYRKVEPIELAVLK